MLKHNDVDGRDVIAGIVTQHLIGNAIVELDSEGKIVEVGCSTDSDYTLIIYRRLGSGEIEFGEVPKQNLSLLSSDLETYEKFKGIHILHSVSGGDHDWADDECSLRHTVEAVFEGQMTLEERRDNIAQAIDDWAQYKAEEYMLGFDNKQEEPIR